MKLFILTLLALVLSFNILSQSNPLLPEDYADYPDPLMIAGNSRVADTEDWNNKRTEILNLFSDHIYGNFPEAPDSMKFFIKEERMLLTGIPCIFKNVNITAFRNGDSASFRTIIYFPVSPKPVPVFVLLNHRKIGSMEAKSAFIKEYWPADKIIQQGFATAMVISGDVSPDDKNEFHKGVISGLFPDELSRANGMKTISAWAWGASRVLDYLETDSLVNTQKAALIGHSRSGKTSLWCGANDERFKLVVSNNSGNSGAALSSRDVGEDSVYESP